MKVMKKKTEETKPMSLKERLAAKRAAATTLPKPALVEKPVEAKKRGRPPKGAPKEVKVEATATPRKKLKVSPSDLESIRGMVKTMDSHYESFTENVTKFTDENNSKSVVNNVVKNARNDLQSIVNLVRDFRKLLQESKGRMEAV